MQRVKVNICVWQSFTQTVSVLSKQTLIGGSGPRQTDENVKLPLNFFILMGSSFSHFKTFILFLVLCFALIVLVGNLLTYVSNAGEWRITGVCRSLFKNIYIFQQGCSGWPALIFENCVIISSRKPRVLNWWLKQGRVMVVKQFIFWPLEMLDSDGELYF